MWNSVKRYGNTIRLKLGRLLNLNRGNESINVVYDNRLEVEKWLNIYRGGSPWVGDYIGAKNDARVKVTSGDIASSIASTLAKKVSIELGIKEIDGSKETVEFMEKQAEEIIGKTRRYAEQVLVQGGGIIKPFFNGERIGLDFYNATSFIPLRFNDFNELVSVILIDRIEEGGKVYTRLEIHDYDEDDRVYTVRNTIHAGQGIDFSGRITNEIDPSVIDIWEDYEREVVLVGEDFPASPLFVYVKTPFTNINDIDSPLGASVFNKVENLLKDYDEQYSLYIHELKVSRKKILVPREFYLDKEGEVGDIIVTMDTDGGINGELSKTIETFSPDIRENDYKNGMETVLRRIEVNTGLSYGMLSRVDNVEKTAEEIKNSKQTLWTTVVDIQKSLDISYIKLMHIIKDLAVDRGLISNSNKEFIIEFDWDDSIIVDKGTMEKNAREERKEKREEMKEMREDVASGYISPLFYIMAKYELTEEEAKKVLNPNNNVADE